jgi:hypothetical protein
MGSSLGYQVRGCEGPGLGVSGQTAARVLAAWLSNP